MPSNSVFITFEGGEGTGKSTQIKRLAALLTGQGADTMITREPGGTASAETIRGLLVNGEPGRWSAMAETLLIYAARDDHLNRVIRPALEEGRIVLCDRFMDSTMAYQGIAGGAGEAFVNMLDREVIGGTVPDLTLIFDLDPAVGLRRAGARSGDHEDRFERKGVTFHSQLRDAFQKIAEANPDRCKLIDASRSEDEVANTVWQAVEPFLTD